MGAGFDRYGDWYELKLIFGIINAIKINEYT